MGKSEDIIAKQDKEAMDRQCLSVSAMSTMVNTLKETNKENIFAQGKSKEDIQKWAEESEGILAMADHSRDKQPKLSCHRSHNITRRETNAGIREALE